MGNARHRAGADRHSGRHSGTDRPAEVSTTVILTHLLAVIHGPGSVITDELGLAASAARAEDLVKILRLKVEHLEHALQLIGRGLLDHPQQKGAAGGAAPEI